MCPESQGSIPIESLWNCFNPAGFKRGSFLLLKCYIDESYSDRMFTLSAAYSSGNRWLSFVSAWKKRIAAKNRSLRAEGRRQVSRFHAADLSSCRGEFEGWTTDEQIAFVKELLGVFRTTRMHTNAYSMPLDVFLAEFPNKDKNAVLGECYAILLQHLMGRIASELDEAEAKGRQMGASMHPVQVALIHDRSGFDSVLLAAFNEPVNNPRFSGRGYFVSITALGWEQCVPLQAADLLAYEHMKESDRLASETSRKQRKSQAALLDMPLLGGRTFRFDADSVHDLKLWRDRNIKP